MTIVNRVLGLFMSGLAMSAGAVAAAAGEAAPRGVVELFTSQGCSSCPPADALMNRLAQDRSLVALTFPVDYWDYLGWKDTLARPEFSQRQRGYAGSRGDRAIYTPQMVVNGREHVVGSDQAAIDRSVSGQRDRFGGLPVETAIEVKGDVVTARVGEARNPADSKATLWLVVFDRNNTVPIGRGENRGRQVTYSNVVRQVQPIGMWKGKPLSVELPKHDLMPNDNTGMAVLLQVDADGKPGAILGAALLAGPSS
ncbi:DUF1223 domain-containing protein [Prosthecomicrobium sp. N25]|uniref:DUF1223 domain-containing protein n=1 Tax=Prosthecomicrobium sp. N25 TaxID=3129254 RepID=UPI003076FEDA